MPSQLKSPCKPRSRDTDSLTGVSMGLWFELAQAVRDYQPDVVILVARKMPRLAEALRLDFGSHTVLCSDLAIPFVHESLKGARVAIVDDLVNRGTTMQDAYSRARICGVADARLFSIGSRANHRIAELPLTTVLCTPLTSDAYRRFVTVIPEIIQSMGKPFDIEFPVLRTGMSTEVNNSTALVRILSECMCDCTVHDLLWPSDFTHLRRITIDLPQLDSTVRKVRLYVDNEQRTCSLVPMVLHASLESFGFVNESVADLYDALDSLVSKSPSFSEVWAGEALARAALFCASLDVGLELLGNWPTLFEPLDDVLVSEIEPALLFGPTVAPSVRALRITSQVHAHQRREIAPTYPQTPFVSNLDRLGSGRFLECVREECGKRELGSVSFVLDVIFDILAEFARATEQGIPDTEWPYSESELQRAPYLRLRIGPTIPDLIALLQMLIPRLADDLALASKLLSEQLDLAIDDGAIVPTIARYDGVFCRIYRRGESPPKDLACRLVAYGINRLPPERRHSMTRVSKLNAILAYSTAAPDLLWPNSLERGAVATLQERLLDQAPPNIVEYLQDTGDLEGFFDS